MNSCRLVVDDLCVPTTQAAVLRDQLAPMAGTGVETIWLSQRPLDPPARWDVEPLVAAALAARFWALTDESSSDRTLFLTANCWLEGPLDELLARSSGIAFVSNPAGTIRVVDLEWCLVDQASPMWRQVAAELRARAGSYDDVADYTLEIAPPDPSSFGARSLTAFQQRPWYSLRADASEQWVARVFELIDRGALDAEVVRADVSYARVRPSLWFQVTSRLCEPDSVPPTIEDLDLAFVPPPLAIDAARRAYLLAPTTALRNQTEYTLRRLRKNPSALIKQGKALLQSPAGAAGGGRLVRKRSLLARLARQLRNIPPMRWLRTARGLLQPEGRRRIGRLGLPKYTRRFLRRVRRTLLRPVVLLGSTARAATGFKRNQRRRRNFLPLVTTGTARFAKRTRRIVKRAIAAAGAARRANLLRGTDRARTR